MTKEEIINDYLKIVISNNYKCQHCALCHGNWCFFGYDCIAHDFMHYTEED